MEGELTPYKRELCPNTCYHSPKSGARSPISEAISSWCVRLPSACMYLTTTHNNRTLTLDDLKHDGTQLKALLTHRNFVRKCPIDPLLKG